MLRRLVLAVVLAVLSLSAAVPASASPPGIAGEYELTDVGTLGGTASFGLGLHESGEVVGTSRTGTASRPQLAFSRDPRTGALTSLGTLPGSTFSRAFAVNGRGWAVGEAFTAPPEVSRAVLWRDGRIVDLGTLNGAAGAVANDVNDRGQVTGTSGGSAFVWERGELRAVGALIPGGTSRGNAISDRGLIAGAAQTAVTVGGARVSHAFLAVPRRGEYALMDLGALGGPEAFSTAYGVNDRGQVVGESVLTPGSGTYRAFAWERGRMRDLGTLGARRHSRANDVNARGVVVGHATGFYGFPTLDGSAVAWDGGTAVDLNERIAPGSGWVLRTAEAIDDRGRIVGYGTVAGQTRAFLLTPERGRH